MIKNKNLFVALLLAAVVSVSGFEYASATDRQVVENGEMRTFFSDNFTDLNARSDNGGAIKNDGKITSIRANFRGNSAKNGGAIYNSSIINLITKAVFSDNKTTGDSGYGGAIFNARTGIIGEIIDSRFENNFATELGGAIYTRNGLTIKNSNFIGNIANKEIKEGREQITYGQGGAIVLESGTLDISGSLFQGNRAGLSGGAINSEDVLKISNSKFYYNTALGRDIEYSDDIKIQSDWGYGGAIDSAGELAISDSEFVGNRSGYGGAISAYGDTTITNTTFKNNEAKVEHTLSLDYTGADGEVHTESLSYTSGLGGAIMSQGQLTIKDSLFENNSSGDDGGGAIGVQGISNDIINSTFNSNSTQGDGGAITTVGAPVPLVLNIEDTNFTGNSADGKGGAIYVAAAEPEDPSDIFGNILSISAKNKDVLFSGNNAEEGKDIYLDENALLVLTTENNNTIQFDGGIVGNNAYILMMDSETGTPGGGVVLNAPVTPAEDASLDVYLSSGLLTLNDESYLNGTDLILGEGSTLNLMNNQVGTMELNSITSNNANINIDMDLSNEGHGFDFINANSASGVLNLKNVNILKDFDEGVNNFYVPLGALGVPSDFQLTTDGTLNTITNDYIYSITAADNNLTVRRLTDPSGNAKQIDSFTIAVNQNDTVSGVDVSVSENRSFSATRDIEITGSTDTGWTGNVGGTDLVVNGQGYTLKGENNTGFYVGSGKNLTFNDTNISGFETSSSRKGALTVGDGGNLSINSINNNITLGGVTAQEGADTNIIYLDGTSSNAFMQTFNGTEITVNNDIRSNSKNNVITLAGDGKITFNGIVDPVTLKNTNANTVHNSYVDDVVYNLDGGVVSFTKDEYLNGISNKNSLNFNGGTLNLANGAVGDISLAELNISKLSNIRVDADLANEKMDTLTADTVIAADKLNVSGINLLSSTDKEVLTLNFTDNADLAAAVTTTVGNVAYSDIYKYGVGYDPTRGDFTFTRGAGHGKNDYNAYNPAVFASPVAAQLGGYMGMIDTYNNAFYSMDMQMLKPLSMRLAEQKANQYAISDSGKSGLYEWSDSNSKDVWVRPFFAYDSVKLKNGPKVNNLSYGTFIGGDSEFHKLKNGFYGTISPFISYQGSYQSYDGNHITQNGGTVGVSSTFYKGNFFNGTTIGIGTNIAEASTMFDHKTFPVFMTGIANKAGYNWEFKEGRFILQPSVLLSYTFVNTSDYTTKLGTKIDSDPLHAVQVSPSVRFIYNSRKGWQPYAHFGMMWNLMDESKVTVNSTSLPELSMKPYFQYGLGIQKLYSDNFTAYGQIMIRNGGRNGIAANLGGRYAFGKESTITDAQPTKIKEQNDNINKKEKPKKTKKAKIKKSKKKADKKQAL